MLDLDTHNRRIKPTAEGKSGTEFVLIRGTGR